MRVSDAALRAFPLAHRRQDRYNRMGSYESPPQRQNTTLGIDHD
jgi:hypothetical protein